ncbi:hypothetical protein CO660_00165 [Rhizobium sp. L9]|uniref:hypothetical protein n=1 Tax=Rhizobium sp. L9 TaxID=1340738 RepID=UPI000BE7BEB1|nr:hypothetical protein [Rhizobium sp. L9]PDT32289.1 hypothetical protein CO660_00165 [Rhizobium sp. L9]
MSGPKVVRVVTREEIIATCQGHLAALDAAFEQWLRVGKRNNILEDRDTRSTESRIASIHELLRQDRFTELQKQAAAEIVFLKADIEARITRAAEKAAQARNEDKRRARAASALAKALADEGLAVPPALQNPVSHSRDELAVAVNKALTLLASSVPDGQITERQRELAAKLNEKTPQITIAEWLATQPATIAEDPRLSDLERRYEELHALDPERAAKFDERMEKVRSDQSNRQSLLIDSLSLDLASERRAAVEYADAVERLLAVKAQLRNHDSPAAASHLAEVEAILGRSAPLIEISNATIAATATVEAALQARAEHDRRQAILAGLADLGYEVKEGMQTAWVENGRVVLKSTKRAGYGVEIGGDPSKGMQLRTVGFADQAEPRDAAADISAETEFCGDFSALQAMIAADGGALSVVKALGVGTTAVKRISRAEDTVTQVAGKLPLTRKS